MQLNSFKSTKIGSKVFYYSNTEKGLFKVINKSFNTITIDCKGKHLVFELYTGKSIDDVFSIWHSKKEYDEYIKKQKVVNDMFKAFDYRKSKQQIINILTLKEVLSIEKIIEKINSI